MASLNRSFLYGICFASTTWIVSLYLYFQLTQHDHSFINLTETSQGLNHFRTDFSSKKKYFYEKYNNYMNGNKFFTKNQLDIKHDDETVNIGLIKSPEDQKIKEEGYKIHAFNVLISNRLGYNRSIPDTRNALCKNKNYGSDLPQASIIICFYNEHFQTLLRTVHSVLNRTPDKLLMEILLINDSSDIKDLHQDVEEYLRNNHLNKVKLLKTERREGLIRARLLGSRTAQGEVLVFLDSHVEVNVDWLEPLLDRVKDKNSNVVMPIIDIINADTFAYSSSPLVRGGFNWGLHFKWEGLPKGTLVTKENFVKPIMSPTMAGGLFAINKKYFMDIGEYDAGMNIWGGENLEISFRIWMCGGTLELLPCSRVGHIFRHRRPYGSPDGEDTMLHNSLRVAHVWMDEYKDYYLKQRPDAKGVSYGDISSRIQLRKELKCYDFDWYLKHVYPELILPTDDERRLKNKWSAMEHDKFQPWHSRKRNYIDQYAINLSNSSLCIQSAKDHKSKGSSLVLRPCTKGKNQMWFETDKSELVLAQLLCLQAGKVRPILYKCHEMGSDQAWNHKGENETPIYNLAAGMCLAAEKKSVNANIVLKLCTDPHLTNWDLMAL